MAVALGKERDKVDRLVRERSRHYLTEAKQSTRGARFDAVQAAALELLAHHDGPYRERAELLWRELYRPEKRSAVSAEADPMLLETLTFFTELRQRPELRNLIWPEPSPTNLDESFRAVPPGTDPLGRRPSRAPLPRSVRRRQRLPANPGPGGFDRGRWTDQRYLDELERQAAVPTGDRDWSAVDELRPCGPP
ncbi:hypothetical protein V2I01_38685 [Micromonospora sp. BRA006-A]|nr:hypothetical protein [Micromonospora sp. BRA006-A]